MLPLGHGQCRTSLGRPLPQRGFRVGDILLPDVPCPPHGHLSPMGRAGAGAALPPRRAGGCCPLPCPFRPLAREFYRLTGSVPPPGGLWPHGTPGVHPAAPPAHPGEHLPLQTQG